MGSLHLDVFTQPRPMAEMAPLTNIKVGLQMHRTLRR
jgi:hypothetical protein